MFPLTKAADERDISEMRFVQWYWRCPKCKREGTLNFIMYRIDETIEPNMLCGYCGTEVHFE